MSDWQHYELDGAVFRGRKGSHGVDEVFNEREQKWKPYQGKDKIKPVFFGDRCDDPLAGAEAPHAAATMENEVYDMDENMLHISRSSKAAGYE